MTTITAEQFDLIEAKTIENILAKIEAGGTPTKVEKAILRAAATPKKEQPEKRVGRLDNPRHEKFAQAVARGLKAAEAYRQVYGPKKYARKTASVLLQDVDISGRIAELQRKSADGTVLTIAEMHEFLRANVRTPAGEIDQNSPLCQSVKTSDTGIELKMPDKLAALKLSAQLQGLLREKVDVEHTAAGSLEDALAQMIGAK